MQRISFTTVAVSVLLAGACSAQVLSPPEIRDPELRELQQQHFADLKRAAMEISAHNFPYRLCFSRTLDLTEAQQQGVDQRSIRFDKFQNQTVLQMTANYFASYSAELMKKDQRAQRTVEDVAIPMLQAAIPAVEGEEKVQAFAIEISQHVRKKVLGVTDENSENVALILPAAAAKQFMAAVTPGDREAALMEGQLFVNRQPVAGWGQTHARAIEVPPPPVAPPAAASSLHVDASAETLRTLQASHQQDLDTLVRTLDPQAHFISYAPPAFIEFRKASYLQLSIKTTLAEASAASQYEMAALAFDEHVAHLIRPVLSALKGDTDFEGVDFSTSVRFSGAGEGTSIEFMFPAQALRSYQNYDLTGQELIARGFVLINGERVSLDLQTAEAGGPRNRAQ